MGGGSPDRWPGSKVHVLCAEPKEHKRFRPGTRPGGIGFPAGRIGDRGDRENCLCAKCLCAFSGPWNFRNFSGKTFRKVPAVLGVWPRGGGPSKRDFGPDPHLGVLKSFELNFSIETFLQGEF